MPGSLLALQSDIEWDESYIFGPADGDYVLTAESVVEGFSTTPYEIPVFPRTVDGVATGAQRYTERQIIITGLMVTSDAALDTLFETLKKSPQVKTLAWRGYGRINGDCYVHAFPLPPSAPYTSLSAKENISYVDLRFLAPAAYIRSCSDDTVLYDA